MIKEIKNFIGTAKHDDFKGTYIWGVDKDGDHQMIAEVRGWGAIQNLFKNKDGSINFEEAEQFQEELGKFIAEAINEKLNKQEESLGLKDWDVTLNDGLKDEPYISDNFQIGPDGAYEHTEEWNKLPKKKAIELVNKFSNECLLTEDGGKVAALLAVEEILNTIEYSSQSDELSKVNYWIEVKREIEKL